MGGIYRRAANTSLRTCPALLAIGRSNCRRYWRFLRRTLAKVAIQFAAVQERSMAPLIHNSSSFQYQNAIGPGDRRRLVGNQKHRSALPEKIQGIE